VIAAGRRGLAAPVLWILAPVVVVALLRPWTVRPLDGARRVAFDARTFAVSAWPRVLREATQTAGDVSELAIQAGSSPAQARFLKGTGVVVAIDRQSRVGVMRVQVATSKPALVAIQIGPVIRGTALRDASSFIRFSDFTNQFEFAGAATALNDHALRSVVGAMPVDTLVGRTVTFIGAISRSPLREDGAIEIVPAQLELVQAGGK
jgi:predicted lipoprotein